ncbi:GTPase ObgE [Candidatus Woesebacteria bacterium]|nr:GTPase ObgE [Candidatus Woesebacteria bacterium]
MLIDDITITVEAGKGGDGSISFRKEKFIPRGGPDGGNGGWGGSVYVVGVNDISALQTFRFKKEIKAQAGEPGRGKKQFGARGEDIELRIPVGSIITDTLTGDIWEITSVGEQYLVARGGRGGRGNHEFKTSTDKTPYHAEPGRPGKFRTLHINLHFIADVGLIGLPSAGKSSLLNALTNAEVKVGDYPFTTLEPHLGMLERTVIADIPGLIEGAHSGKGLGVKFLKHIEKTSLLVHCIDGTSQDVHADYKTIRKELEQYNPLLISKEEIILVTKTDLLTEKEIKEKVKKLSEFGSKVLTCSIIDDESLATLKKAIVK